MQTLLLIALFSLTLQITFKCSPLVNFSFATLISPVNQTCPINSHCLENGFCGCDVGFIGGCTQPAFRMQNAVQISAEVGSQAYTFFQIIGNTQIFTLLSFTFCIGRQTSSDFYIDVWDDDGLTDTFTKQNAESNGKVYSLSDNCLALNTPYMLFGNKTNGENQGFILGLKKVQEGSQELRLKVQITELDFWGLMIKITFILGSCFLVVLSAAIIFVIYKWRRRELIFSNEPREKDISHLETYMPRTKIQWIGNERLASELCSICLIQLGQTQFLRRTVCLHVFHQDCLDSWCRNHLSCPVCRRSFQLEQLRNGNQGFDQLDTQGLRQRFIS